MQFDSVDAVGEDFLLGHGLDLGLLFGFFQLAGIEGGRGGENLLVVGLVDLMSNDRGALSDERAQPAGVIEMSMRIDYILDGFVGDQPLGFRDDGQGALLALRTFHHDDAVLKIRDHCGVPAENQPHAVAELL